MPIYEYLCKSCHHQFDKIQKMSDAPLETCPKCGQNALEKQVSAPGFQLKGSGWYVTDFRGDKPKGSSESGGSESSSPTTTSSSESSS